jgi:hypothetical protein
MSDVNEPALDYLKVSGASAISVVGWPVSGTNNYGAELQQEVLLGGVEGDPTQCQGARDQGQKNDSSAQHGQRRRVIEKTFLVATNYLFTSTTTRQITMRRFARHGAN